MYAMCHVLFLIVPPFNVAISQNYNDPIYTGTNLTLTCDIELNSLVDIPYTVANQWTRNDLEITQDTITSDLVEVTTLEHTATLQFNTLYHVTDDGVYECSVMITSNEEYVNPDEVSNNDSTMLDVLGKLM